jgi:hypothetical protein
MAKIKEIMMSAVIPTAQYANITPAITVEVDDDVEEAKALAMSHIVGISKQYAEKGKALKGNAPTTMGSDFKKVTSFTGEEIYWDELHHIGLSLDGVSLKGGSGYAAKKVPFDRVNIIKNCAKAWKVSEDDVDKLWSNNAASELGTSIHSALEHYFLYKGLGAKVHAVKKDSEYNAALPSNDYLREIVLNFERDFPLTNQVIPEALVSDVERERCGWIDFLEIVDLEKKICIINDFKSGQMKETDVKKANHQMSFYADILAKFGWTTQELRAFYLQGTNFKRVEMKVLPVTE